MAEADKQIQEAYEKYREEAYCCRSYADFKHLETIQTIAGLIQSESQLSNQMTKLQNTHQKSDKKAPSFIQNNFITDVKTTMVEFQP